MTFTEKAALAGLCLTLLGLALSALTQFGVFVRIGRVLQKVDSNEEMLKLHIADDKDLHGKIQGTATEDSGRILVLETMVYAGPERRARPRKVEE